MSTTLAPKLWTEDLESHRRDVRGAILDAAAALVAEHGLASVTMSDLAKSAGIGRATLYKYFSDVNAVFAAWHERSVASHLAELLAAHARPGTPAARLEAILETYARLAHAHHGSELVALMSGGEHVARSYAKLTELIAEVIAEGAAAGELRDDVTPAELASFSIHALGAAASAPSRAAVRRLVAVTLTGLRRAKR
uniref:Transcriptional regulator TetR family n=1 Tax=Aetherobacter fasciculatus TaxID=888830 RepID=A0A3Q8IB68_9BACT|nr:transcriptional regulator TetR family [Aetherobacter fasciculatus]